ncbi:MAG TPA: ROK family protein [Sulfuricaulis sp.]|nr:ROK family protein [Sulfuricaulis sp.]
MLRIGIDLGGTKTEGIVMDEAEKIILRKRLTTPQTDGYDAILQSIYTLVRDLEKKTGQACRVGVGTPGSISTRTDTLKNSNTICLNGKPIQQDLEKILDRSIRIANDANCFALSEAIDGAGQGAGIVFGVILGTGVGGGIVINGKLHEGPQHIAGEWGHNILEADGPPCYCGKRGCVETFLSGPGLVQDWARHGGDAALAAKNIVALAEQGDPQAEAALRRYLYRFGKALSVVINILDPDVVVLGGGMSNIRRLYSEGPDFVRGHVFNDELRTRILPNAHGDSSGVRGAAQLWPAETTSIAR